MQELEITRQRVLSVWWCAWGRGMVGAILGGGVLGFLIGFFNALLKLGLPDALPGIVGAILGIVWSFVVIRMALRKQYKEFRIVLVPHQAVT
jgi:F420-0:gamma-glutamyl ligase-like protein